MGGIFRSSIGRSFESMELRHYGTPRHSGRYPYGSGDNPYQRAVTFRKSVHELKKKGVPEKDIAKSYGLTIRQLRNRLGVAKNEERTYLAEECLRLRDKGMSPTAIGKRMEIPESSVRSLLDPAKKERADKTKINADKLKEAVSKDKYIDVTSGTELYLGITKDRMAQALTMLKDEGYEVHKIKVKQLGTGNDTNMEVLCGPGTTWSEVNANKTSIKLPEKLYSEDGITIQSIESPKSISSSRVKIRYADELDKDGIKGIERDGMIQIRRGVEDLSLGNAKYAQVRILVDGTHYLKGMAVYADDIPDGVDIVFNTNKPSTVPMMGPKGDDTTVLKPIKKDPDNPFGASIQEDKDLIKAQRHYIDENGDTQLSALNIVREEGQWNKWNKTLASQFLSKQYPALAKQQLDISRKVAQEEFDEISSVTNPIVKADLLEQFASKCDSAATDLAAAALPRQTTKVILSFPDMKEDEIYCPNLNNGEKVALVRYPHGGIFEIPVLTVNNNVKSCRDIINNAEDACGIHPKAAEKLSGADFDGDTALVIPIDNVKIKAEANNIEHGPYKELYGWADTLRTKYKKTEGMHYLTNTGLEMGKITNLITDMTVAGAPAEDLVKAVKHSMVIIDAEKHELNYKQSEIDHDIAGLRLKYRGSENGGAATLLSQSTAESRILSREKKRVSQMSEEEKALYFEGHDIYKSTGDTYTKPKMHTVTKKVENPDGSAPQIKVKEEVKEEDGNTVYVTSKNLDSVSRMSQTDDAYTLTSKIDPNMPHGKNNTTKVEAIYADYANDMKALAIRCRKEARAQQPIDKSKEAAEAYDLEVKQIKAQLLDIEKNAPLERQAQLIGTQMLKQLLYSNPSLKDDKEKYRKEKGRMLKRARDQVGAKKKSIILTDRQWEAINAGAFSKSTLKKILDNADKNRVKELALPKEFKGLSEGKKAQAVRLMNSGYQQNEVAAMLGVSVSTMLRAINEKS